MRRVLGPEGALVVAAPTPRHLRGLVEALGLLHVDERKEERLEDSLGPWFERSDIALIEDELRLRRDEVADLVAMGPSARHGAADVERVPEPVTVTSSVEVATYLPRP
jgi:23S rRNA (guanine745-N1)-methyltransferase